MIVEIYGLQIDCKCDDPDFTKVLIRPFRFFQKEGSAHSRTKVTVVVKRYENL